MELRPYKKIRELEDRLVQQRASSEEAIVSLANQVASRDDRLRSRTARGDTSSGQRIAKDTI